MAAAQLDAIGELRVAIAAVREAAVTAAAAQQAAAAAAQRAAAAQEAAAAVQQAAAAPPAAVGLDGKRNIIEALGFLKDWVTALVTMQTAAVAALAVYLQTANLSGLSLLQRLLIFLTIAFFIASISFGGMILYMLPGSVQRTPPADRDVFYITTIGSLDIGFWARLHWPAFLFGVFAFGLFMGARALNV